MPGAGMPSAGGEEHAFLAVDLRRPTVGLHLTFLVILVGQMPLDHHPPPGLEGPW